MGSMSEAYGMPGLRIGWIVTLGRSGGRSVGTAIEDGRFDVVLPDDRERRFHCASEQGVSPTAFLPPAL